MRLRLTGMTLILITILFILPTPVKAENHVVTSTDLIENASELDGKTVSYSGEAIGDILYRGDYAWINVSDGANAIGIYIPASEARKIEYVGRYRVIGDTVFITGTFYRACAEDGGDLDIHANAINVTKKGHTVEDNPSTGLLVSAGVMFICAFAVAIRVFKKRAN